MTAVSFTQGSDRAAVKAAAERAAARAAETGGRVCLVMTETPGNPTNALVDLKLMRARFPRSSARARAAGVPRYWWTTRFSDRCFSVLSCTAPTWCCIR